MNGEFFSKRRGNGKSYGSANPPPIEVENAVEWFREECNTYIRKRGSYVRTSQLFPLDLERRLECQNAYFRVRNSLQSLVDEAAAMCIAYGYDPTTLYKIVEAASHYPDTFKEYWPEVNATLRMVNLKHQLSKQPAQDAAKEKKEDPFIAYYHLRKADDWTDLLIAEKYFDGLPAKTKNELVNECKKGTDKPLGKKGVIERFKRRCEHIRNPRQNRSNGTTAN